MKSLAWFFVLLAGLCQLIYAVTGEQPSQLALGLNGLNLMLCGALLWAYSRGERP